MALGYLLCDMYNAVTYLHYRAPLLMHSFLTMLHKKKKTPQHLKYRAENHKTHTVLAMLKDGPLKDGAHSCLDT